MSMKFADGSHTHLTIDTIQLIRDSVACAVVVLERGERIKFLETIRDEQAALTKRRFSDLNTLGRALTNSLTDQVESSTSDLSEVSDRIRQATSDEVAVEVRKVRETFDSELAQSQREINELTLEWHEIVTAFLLENDLPGSRGRISIRLNDAEEYEGFLRVENDTGVTATFRLAIPTASPFTKRLQLSDLVDQLKVRVPHKGWLRGERVAKRNLGRYLITRMVHTRDTTMLRINKRGVRSGFDLRFSADDPNVSIRAIGLPGDRQLPEHLAVGEDAEQLQELYRVVSEIVDPLSSSRGETRSVRFEGIRLSEMSADLVAQRIIDSIAALMREARRALCDERVQLNKLVQRLPVNVHYRFKSLGLLRPSIPPPPPPRRRYGRPGSFNEINQGWSPHLPNRS